MSVCLGPHLGWGWVGAVKPSLALQWRILLAVPGGASFVDLLCFFLSCVCCAFMHVCLYVHCDRLLFVASWLSFVSLSLSWVRCGTRLYRFPIFAPLLTFLACQMYHKGKPTQPNNVL